MFFRHIKRKFSAQDVCIIGYGRSPTGQYGGIFKGISSINLAAQVCEGTISKFSIPKSSVETSYTGIYLFSDIGPSPTKQVAAKINLPESLNCTYVNKLCASGFKAVMMGAIDVMAGQSKLVLAGGMEHMTEALFHLPKEEQRKKVVTTFTCLIEGKMLTIIADDYAKKRGITREEQDDFALASLARARAAKAAGKLQEEIIPVNVDGKVESEDELKEFADVVRTIRPVCKGGSVTSITTAPFGDGACYLLLCSREEARKMGARVYGSIVGMGEHENTSAEFVTSHYKAMDKALKRAGRGMGEIDLFEFAETFALVPILTQKDLGIDGGRVNIYGGDLAYGHPPGTTGVKMIISLLSALKNEGKELGMIAMPGACGGGSAIIIRRE